MHAWFLGDEGGAELNQLGMRHGMKQLGTVPLATGGVLIILATVASGGS